MTRGSNNKFGYIMSYELDYFPPNCGKYKWEDKELNYSPWVCNMTSQVFSDDICYWPFRITCYVDLINNVYVWTVLLTNWNSELSSIEGSCIIPEDAIKEAENVANEYYTKLAPDWVLIALKNKWRPPCN